MTKHNRVVRLSSAGVVVSGAVIVFCLGVLRAAGHAAEPGVAAPPASGASSATVSAPARLPPELPKKTDKTDKSAAIPAAARAAADPARREPRRAAAQDNDPYRCHPNEDIACTVVRETAQGMTIVTVRPGRPAMPMSAASWSVVGAAPPGGTAYPGGIIYVVPTVQTVPPQFQALAQTQEPAFSTANYAPILE
jgi:hypothetical protein